MTGALTRRGALAGALALSGCGRDGGTAVAQTGPDSSGPPPPLRELATVPVGTCLSTGELDDAGYLALLVRQASQITPSWQLKIDAVLQPDGRLDFSAPDRLAAFARTNALGFHGHTLVWYAQEPPGLKRLDGAGRPFAEAVQGWIAAAAGRYRGQALTWDVVNEPIEEDGSGLRPCLYGRNLGAEAYIDQSFHWARAADPGAILILNDFDLERSPAKRRAFLRLAERLLARGAPLGALGTQCHLDVGVDPRAIGPAMRELASLGLPLRVSELDCSTTAGGGRWLSPAGALQRQAALYRATAEAFMALPAHQRLAFCLWGLDDRRSWLRYQAGGSDASDRPLPFDDADQPKPAFWALADTFRRA